MSTDANIQRVNILIARMQGLGRVVFHAPRINVDNALPREIVNDVIDELVMIRRVYESIPSVFEVPTPPPLPPEYVPNVPKEIPHKRSKSK